MATHKGDRKNFADTSEYNDFSADIDIDIPAGCMVVDKPVPAASEYPLGSGKKIRWFNAFGVQRGGVDADETYTVTLENLPKGKQLFYQDKDKVPHDITDKIKATGKKNAAGRDLISFQLSIGDPPIGTYP